jgi:regulator of extracellular matrix RemA (YlzA/DUF370 family)
MGNCCLSVSPEDAEARRLQQEAKKKSAALDVAITREQHVRHHPTYMHATCRS